ncbi:MAG: hypothetical protein V3U33_06680 [candidate division NC10 bacterium]
MTTWQIASFFVARNRLFWIGIAATTTGAILGLLSAFTSPFQGLGEIYAPTIWNWLGIYSGVILFFAGIVLLAVTGTKSKPSLA